MPNPRVSDSTEAVLAQQAVNKDWLDCGGLVKDGVARFVSSSPPFDSPQNKKDPDHPPSTELLSINVPVVPDMQEPTVIRGIESEELLHGKSLTKAVKRYCQDQKDTTLSSIASSVNATLKEIKQSVLELEQEGALSVHLGAGKELLIVCK